MRLNQRHKNQLVKLIVDQAMADDEAASEVAEQKAADRVYRACYTPKQIELMNSLPDGWLSMSGSVLVTYRGEWVRLHFAEHDARRFPENSPQCDRIIDDVNDPLWPVLEKLLKLKAVVNDRRNDLTAEVRAVVNASSTTEALVKKWPECKPFVEKVCGEKQVMLPAINLKKLNKALGLKSSA